MKKKNGPGLIYNEQMSTSSCRHLSQSMHVPVNQWTNSGFNIKIIEDSIFSEEQKIMREILGQITNLQSFLLNTPSSASQVGRSGPWDCACCLAIAMGIAAGGSCHCNSWMSSFCYAGSHNSDQSCWQKKIPKPRTRSRVNW